MIILLLVTYLVAQAQISDCNVRVDLPFIFREHTPRFRGHGFQVNGFGSEKIIVRGILAAGHIRLETLVVSRIVRGEPVEVGRVNAQLLQGLPSQMIARSIPLIQSACAQSSLDSARELCPIELSDIKEEKEFRREAPRCDILRFAQQVSGECEAEGFRFCFTEMREYDEDLTRPYTFEGTNCRVVIKGTKRFSFEEHRQMLCEGLSSCYYEILSTPSLNTTYRRERLERDLRLNECSPQINLNQSERSSMSDTPASAAPRDRSTVRPQ
ncbi:MAG: hypothetical protein LW878_04140 [Proteobacteria bacterium]|nr:hypothetical protein [Pseudomonadota bacterium]